MKATWLEINDTRFGNSRDIFLLPDNSSSATWKILMGSIKYWWKTILILIHKNHIKISTSKTGTKTNAIPTKRTSLTLTLRNWFVDLTQIHKIHVLLPSFLGFFDHSRYVWTEPVQLYKLMFYSSLIRDKSANLKTVVSRKQSTSNLPKNDFPKNFLPQTYVCILRLTLLPYYWRFIDSWGFS